MNCISEHLDGCEEVKNRLKKYVEVTSRIKVAFVVVIM